MIVLRVHKIQKPTLLQFLHGVTENFMPRFVHFNKISVRIRDTEQIQIDRKELFQFFRLTFFGGDVVEDG